MKYLKVILQLLTTISIVIEVNSQLETLPMKSDNCHRPAEFMYRQCCIFPPFFTRDIAKECGARFAIVKNDKVQELNITLMIREADTDELHWRCVLNKYKILTPENNVQEEKYFAHLDKWTKLNPVFVKVMHEAKSECKLAYGINFPLEVKEFYKLNGCVRNYVNTNCPNIIPTKECEELKKFYEECGKFFTKK
ncbi:hypothetical protein K1T71_001133 [Dendrolimus kikuchii]|uniref:Uncharacterized protein n=1 Tax=Dendrolimus kikuchii TaxID=765133 RepID=A0ACC1DIB6_9NEOP|nr:hypothetical protein K1T71_001133 [Dendrolimus kikuchii]